MARSNTQIEDTDGGANLPAAGDAGARAARMAAILTLRVEGLLQGIEAGLPVDPKEVAALSSLVQLSERVAALAEAEAQAQARQRDDDLRVTLRRIDDRIVYLATAHARALLVEAFGIPQADVDARLPALGPE